MKETYNCLNVAFYLIVFWKVGPVCAIRLSNWYILSVFMVHGDLNGVKMEIMDVKIIIVLNVVYMYTVTVLF